MFFTVQIPQEFFGQNDLVAEAVDEVTKLFSHTDAANKLVLEYKINEGGTRLDVNVKHNPTGISSETLADRIRVYLHAAVRIVRARKTPEEIPTPLNEQEKQEQEKLATEEIETVPIRLEPSSTHVVEGEVGNGEILIHSNTKPQLSEGEKTPEEKLPEDQEIEKKDSVDFTKLGI